MLTLVQVTACLSCSALFCVRDSRARHVRKTRQASHSLYTRRPQLKMRSKRRQGHWTLPSTSGHRFPSRQGFFKHGAASQLVSMRSMTLCPGRETADAAFLAGKLNEGHSTAGVGAGVLPAQLTQPVTPIAFKTTKKP